MHTYITRIQMDKQKITEKLNALMKYIPFIDFIIQMDKGKYMKFIDIKKWIINRKRYPLSDLNKIEQSIITQYKNLMVLDDKKIPEEITQIFCDETKLQYVNLCSDDDENCKQDNQNISTKSTDGSKQCKSNEHLNKVPIICGEKPKSEYNSKLIEKRKVSCNNPKENSGFDKDTLNDKTYALLRQIDQISCNEKQRVDLHKPLVIGRGTDRDRFENKSKENDTNEHRRRKVCPSAVVVGTISLDSSDEETSLSLPNKDRENTKNKNVLSGIVNKQKSNVRKKARFANTNRTPASDISIDIDAIDDSNFNNDQKEDEPANNSIEKISSDRKSNNAQLISQPPLNKEQSTDSNLAQDCQKISVFQPQAVIKNDIIESRLQITNKCVAPTAQGTCVASAEYKRSKAKEPSEEHLIKRTNSTQAETDDIRSILMNTLQPYEGVIASMWVLHKTPTNENINKQKFNVAEMDCEINDQTKQLKDIEEIIEEKEETNKTSKEQNNSKKSNCQKVNDSEMYDKTKELTEEKVIENSKDLDKSKSYNAIRKEEKSNETSCQKQNLNAVELIDKISQAHKEKCTEKGMVLSTNKSYDSIEKREESNKSCKKQESSKKSNGKLANAIKMNDKTKEEAEEEVIGNSSELCIDKSYNTIEKGEESNKNCKEQDSVIKVNSKRMNAIELNDKRKCIIEGKIIENSKDLSKGKKLNTTKKEETPTTISKEQQSFEKINCKQANAVELNYKTKQVDEVKDIKKSMVLSKKKEKKVNANKTKEEAKNKVIEKEEESNKVCKELTRSKKSNCHQESAIEMNDNTKEVVKGQIIESSNNLGKNKSHNAMENEEKESSITETNKDKSRIQRINRVFKELKCTFKGYADLQEDIPKGIGLKRRSSVHARTAIAEQLCCKSAEHFDSTPVTSSQSSTQSNIDSEEYTSIHDDTLNTTSQSSTRSKRRLSVHTYSDISEHSDDNVSFYQLRKKSIKVTSRRSSVYARSAIAKQLNPKSENSSDGGDFSGSDSRYDEDEDCHSTLKRRKTIEELSPIFREKLASNTIEDQLNDQPAIDVKKKQFSPSSTTTDSYGESVFELKDIERFRLTKRKRLYESIIQNQPTVLLTPLTEDVIKKYTNRNQNVQEEENIINDHLVESKIQPKDYAVPATLVQKKGLPKKLNNDSEMTANTTTLCSLCSSRPSDLTHHYIRKHKSESYVSRLTWSQLDELSINTPFAKEVESSIKGRYVHYSVICPFCDKSLEAPFMDLYKHYSTHTGEYAFQCSGCHLEKPFKSDIQSHQLHSKTCRRAYIKTLYRYPPNTMIIYLHYCAICNFVQLNEANILRHLRDHHDQRLATVKNVKKLILVAISDGPDTNTALQLSSDDSKDNNQPNGSSTLETEIISNKNINDQVVPEKDYDLNLDDDVLVRNEPCSQKLFDFDPCSLEEQLKQIHDEPVVKVTPPIEGTHLTSLPLNIIKYETPHRTAAKPIIKMDFKPTEIDIDFDSNGLITPPRPSVQKLTISHTSTKSNYRHYPRNVKYLGLYKCMTDDCYYSTDSPNEIVQHFKNHIRANISDDYLQCAYCNLLDLEEDAISVEKLVNHIGTKHLHMLYQCSMCCYRSSEASNVFVHQKEEHSSNYQTCTIYKCSGMERLYETQYVREKIAENVRKLTCQYCSHKSFYHSNLLENHIRVDHKMSLADKLTNYSCIYCPLTSNDKNVIRKHLAFSHPEELPYCCDHNNVVQLSEDLLHTLQSFNMAQPVHVIECSTTLDSLFDVAPKQPVEDVKPTAEMLLKCQEETVKVRLRKLTEKTGVAPDRLYHCPEKCCGGFFSVYDLWLRHMRIKHNCCECRCPHCPADDTRSITDYKDHFEEHRRHTFICFHCSLTFANMENAERHFSGEHIDLGSSRLERIRFNLSYSYFVLIEKEMLANRTDFIPALHDTLTNRLEVLKSNEYNKLKDEWIVSSRISPWLDDYRKDISKKLNQKCFKGDCDYRSMNIEDLLQHARENHSINGITFKCSHCDFRIQDCAQWDEILMHIRQHSDRTFFVCAGCFTAHHSRFKLAKHIKDEHAARDVPIINLIKKDKHIYLRLAVVFANECLSFSTMRNCFCCEEQGMKGDAFIYHLKRYHKFVLNYFCEWCNLPIKSLQSAKEHYRLVHTQNKLKIRCEFASKSDVSVSSIENFQVHIDNEKSLSCKILVGAVKAEPSDNLDNDDSVLILDDDDIIAENSVREQEKIQMNSEKPKLKCKTMDNLLQPIINAPPLSSAKVANPERRMFPRTKIVNSGQSKLSIACNVQTPNKQPGLLYPHMSVPSTQGSSFLYQPVTVTPASSNTNNIILNSVFSNKYGPASSANIVVPVSTAVGPKHSELQTSTVNGGNLVHNRLGPTVPAHLPSQQVGALSRNTNAHLYVSASSGSSVMQHHLNGRSFYSHPEKNAAGCNIAQSTNMIYAAPSHFHQQHIAPTASSSNACIKTVNGIHLPNQSSAYSNPQTIMPACSMGHTIVPTCLPQTMPTPSADTSQNSRNTYTRVMYESTTVSTCVSEMSTQHNSINGNVNNVHNVPVNGRTNYEPYTAQPPRITIHNPYQAAPSRMNHPTEITNNSHQINVSSARNEVVNHQPQAVPSAINRIASYQQHRGASTTSAVNEMTHRPQQTPMSYTMNGMATNQQIAANISRQEAPSAICIMTNRPQRIAIPSIRRVMPNHPHQSSTMSGIVNYPQLEAPSAMSRKSNYPQHIIDPSAMTEAGNRRQYISPSYIMNGTTNNSLYMVPPSATNIIPNRPQHSAAPSTTSAMTNNPRPIAPTSISNGMVNHTQRVSVVSAMNGLLDHTQNMAEPFPIRGMTNSTIRAPYQPTSTSYANVVSSNLSTGPSYDNAPFAYTTNMAVASESSNYLNIPQHTSVGGHFNSSMVANNNNVQY